MPARTAGVDRIFRSGIGPAPVEGLRALVHGHEPVERIACTANRWNIDTGAGIVRLDRLSLVEMNATEFRAWTFDVDESC